MHDTTKNNQMRTKRFLCIRVLINYSYRYLTVLTDKLIALLPFKWQLNATERLFYAELRRMLRSLYLARQSRFSESTWRLNRSNTIAGYWQETSRLLRRRKVSFKLKLRTFLTSHLKGDNYCTLTLQNLVASVAQQPREIIGKMRDFSTKYSTEKIVGYL